MKIYILISDPGIELAIQGPQDFDIDLEFKTWYDANVIKVAGCPVSWDSDQRDSWLSLYREVKASLSMLALGREDGTWNEIFAIHLIENHGFEKLDFEIREFYPEA